MDEAYEPFVLLEEFPVDPGDGIVLAVRIVVAALGTAEFVAGDNHRHALAEKERGEEVADLPISDGVDGAFSGGAFVSVVVAVVVLLAVVVVLAVLVVVLGLVTDQVGQGVPVVRRHEVDALLGLPRLLGIHVRATQQPVHQRRNLPQISPYERTDVVAEAAVPLQEAVADADAGRLQPRYTGGFADLTAGLAVLEARLRPFNNSPVAEIPGQQVVTY